MAKEIKMMTVAEYNRIRNGEWWELVDSNEAKKAHATNIKNVKEAVVQYNEPDRPLRILVVHGSGRSGNKSAAIEWSNSQLLLKSSLEIVKEIDPKIEIEEVNLREYQIEPCNGCLSTTSGLCGFPCDCFPFDDMQKLYPKVLRSDILFCSTPVNQSAMASRLKLFADRLVSLDGGFYRTEEQFVAKNAELKSKLMALEASNQTAYDQRLYGRVAAYFISSKDDGNPLVATNKINYTKEYVKPVAQSLKDGFEDYGYFHDDDFYVGAVSNPDVGYMFDKETLMQNKEALEHGKKVVEKAIKLAKKLKKNLPPFKSDRINRT